jgi:hypothetical protein
MTFTVKVNTFMGRPPGRIQDRPFQMRLSAGFLELLDEWRRKQPGHPSRAEAIRRLTTAMLHILDNDPAEKVGDRAIRQALEDAGIVFVDEEGEAPGVRLRKRMPKRHDSN